MEKDAFMHLLYNINYKQRVTVDFNIKIIIVQYP